MFRVEKDDLSGFNLHGERQEDGSIEIGDSNDPRTVEEWPETATIGHGRDFFTYTLEYVDKQMEDGEEEFEPGEVPDEPGREWGVYL